MSVEATLSKWLDLPARPFPMPVAVRPSIVNDVLDAATQHQLGTLNINAKWFDPDSARHQIVIRWDKEAHIVLFAAPFASWDHNEGRTWFDEQQEIVKQAEVFEQVAAFVEEAGGDTNKVIVAYDVEKFTDEAPVITTRRYSSLEFMAQTVLPGCQVEWYDYGGARPANNDSGWTNRKRYARVLNPFSRISVPLYNVADYYETRTTIVRTFANWVPQEEFNDEHPATIGLWLGARCGYHREPNDVKIRWGSEWTYDPAYLAVLGQEIANPKWSRQRQFMERVRFVYLWSSSRAATVGDVRNLENDLDGDGVVENFEMAVEYHDAFVRGGHQIYPGMVKAAPAGEPEILDEQA